jgi:hypothetical protein
LQGLLQGWVDLDTFYLNLGMVLEFNRAVLIQTAVLELNLPFTEHNQVGSIPVSGVTFGMPIDHRGLNEERNHG